MQTLKNSIFRSEKNLELSQHAWERMTSRGFDDSTVLAVLEYGRVIYIRKAKIHVIGKREVEKFSFKGINLSKYEGVHVVCCPKSCFVLTMYRNRDLSGLKDSRRRHYHAKTLHKRRLVQR